MAIAPAVPCELLLCTSAHVLALIVTTTRSVGLKSPCQARIPFSEPLLPPSIRQSSAIALGSADATVRCCSATFCSHGTVEVDDDGADVGATALVLEEELCSGAPDLLATEDVEDRVVLKREAGAEVQPVTNVAIQMAAPTVATDVERTAAHLISVRRRVNSYCSSYAAAGAMGTRASFQEAANASHIVRSIWAVAGALRPGGRSLLSPGRQVRA